MVKKKIKWVRYIILIIVIGISYSALTGPSGIINVLHLHHLHEKQLSVIDSLNLRKKDLEAEALRLKTDTAYIEIVARKELGMVKPNEKVFRYLPNSQNAENKESKKP